MTRSLGISLGIFVLGIAFGISVSSRYRNRESTKILGADIKDTQSAFVSLPDATSPSGRRTVYLVLDRAIRPDGSISEYHNMPRNEDGLLLIDMKHGWNISIDGNTYHLTESTTVP